MTAAELLFALLRHVVCGQPLGDGIKEVCSEEMLNAVYVLAQRHDIVHLAAHGLEKLDLPKSEPLSKLQAAKTQAIFRYMRQDYEYGRICAVLEKGEIPYIPLKGTVLRAYYPEPWMRNSCDIDILVEEDRLDEAIGRLRGDLGYEVSERGDHDVSLFSSTGVHLELHYDTVQQRYADDIRRSVLAKIWKMSEHEPESSCKYRMPDEMFYFYHFAHMAKHFGNGGCGIRSVLDVWIMNHRISADGEKRNLLLREGGLLSFSRAVEWLAENWFSGIPGNLLSEQVGEYILTGGVYGNKENRAAFGQAKFGGKLRYLFTRRVFMPYDYLKAEYPILKKKKWLMPLYQVVRWFRMLFSGAAGSHLREIIVNVTTQEEKRNATASMLKQLEL